MTTTTLPARPSRTSGSASNPSSHPSGDSATRWPSDVRMLLGSEAGDLLAEYVAHLGGTVRSHRARQVSHQVGHSTTVQYRVRVDWPTGAASGRTTSDETIVLTTADHGDRAARLTDGVHDIAAWRWSDDPALPGLASALDVRRVSALFDDLGVGGHRVELRVRAYRPGRRAVVEATSDAGRVFLKVVAPHRAQALHDVHRTLAETLPVPNSIGWTSDGIVVMPGLAGRTLRDDLRTPNAPLPTPASIDALLARLPDGVGATRPRTSWIESARRHARTIDATVPSVSDALAETLERLEAADDGADDHDITTVHGDMYEAQLLAQRGELTGLLDVDTVGRGRRIDDTANFCAHLSVLATVWTPSGAVRQYGRELLAHAETRYDRSDLRRRIAAAVLGLATGPFRTLEPKWEANTLRRIRLADQWLASAAPMNNR
ncbi:MAG: aminoglycoside phosphotransferase family protein [Ilumatobacter sp.]|uniref:aminoglycoside phosphotransferase family protein n=1 Tax=Ilumatobacter sp. TaxID=1967498 RepID=UPI00329885D2